MSDYTEDDNNGPLHFAEPDKVTHLFSRLRLLGATLVNITFQGSGDSGQVENVSAWTAQSDPVNLEAEDIIWLTEKQQWDDATQGWVMVQAQANVKLVQALTEVFYEADQHFGHDWSNNDGGNGEMTIDFSKSPPAIEVEYHIATISYETSTYNFSGVAQGGE